MWKMKNITGSLRRDETASRTTISPLSSFEKPSPPADSSKADQLHAAHRLSTTSSETQVSDKNKRNRKKNTEHSCTPPPNVFTVICYRRTRLWQRDRERKNVLLSLTSFVSFVIALFLLSSRMCFRHIR